jgi:hypothetical protein
MTEATVQKRIRGKGVKPRLAHVNLRIPQWVLDFYKEKPNFSAAMREVLTKHVVEQQTPKQD